MDIWSMHSVVIAIKQIFKDYNKNCMEPQTQFDERGFTDEDGKFEDIFLK